MQSLVRRGCDACRALVRQITRPASYHNVHQIRTTCVMEHHFPVPVYKQGGNPKINENYEVLRLKVNENITPRSDIQCLLTAYVDEIGFPGEIVIVKRRIFRHELFPLGLAVYPTPENIAEVRARIKDSGQLDKYKNFTPYTRRTLRELSGLHLPIPMNADTDWILNRSHVRVALRKVKVECLDEVCLKLPDSLIVEPGEITLGITVNKTHTVKFRATVYLVDSKNKDQQKPEMPDLWGNEPLEYNELLDY